jgi:hypothetical protein
MWPDRQPNGTKPLRQPSALGGIFMPDSTDITLDLSLVIGPDDEAFFIAGGLYRNRRGRAERSLIYAVIHRRFGLWTHIYRVVPDEMPGRVGLTVYLEKAIQGEAVAEARDWASGQFGTNA